MQKWVLVVDDSHDSARTMTALLSSCNCQAQVANSAAEALRIKDIVRFDAMLIDLMMPEIDGYGLATELRRKGLPPETKVYAVTGYPADPERLKKAGFDGLLAKPVIIDQLQALLGLDCK